MAGLILKESKIMGSCKGSLKKDKHVSAPMCQSDISVSENAELPLLAGRTTHQLSWRRRASAELYASGPHWVLSYRVALAGPK